MNEALIQFEPYEQVLSPRLDSTFKALFTSETPESKAALMDFISTYVEKEVVDVSIVNNEPASLSITDRQIRYDVNCVFNDGERCNVEMTLLSSQYENLRI